MPRSLWHLARPANFVARAQSKFGSRQSAEDHEVPERKEADREAHPDERRLPFLEAGTKSAFLKRHPMLPPCPVSAVNARNLRFADGRRARLYCHIGRTVEPSPSTVRTIRPDRG